jgi:predicted Fe-Mo cluster-binding NifX family protein
MRVAITSWNGRISPVFDVARSVVLADVEGGRIKSRREEPLEGEDPGRQASCLSAYQPNVLICGAISQSMIALLSACDIAVFPFVAGDVEAVLEAHLNGSLNAPAWSMPGCCGRNGHGRVAGRCARNRFGTAQAQRPVLSHTNPKQGINPMKIVLTSTGKTLADPLDLRFGRAKYFILVDVETGDLTVHDNTQNLNAAQGAGIQAGETVARLGAQAVVTGNVGPKAFRILEAAGIKVFLCSAGSGTEAVRKFKAGELKEASTANVEGHWA